MQTLRAGAYHAFVLAAGLLERRANGPSNPSFPTTRRQATLAIRQMRREPAPMSRPLVVVGGIYNAFAAPWYAHFFGSLCYGEKIIPVSVGFCSSFEKCRAKVIDAVERVYPSSDPMWTKPIDVVGASLGGLVARYAAAPSRDPNRPRRLNIARLFTIASPHSGAKMAAQIALCQLHRDMKPQSQFLQSLAGADGSAGYQLQAYVHLNDHTVGERLAAPPGQTPYWLAKDLLIRSHNSAMIDPRILADIALRLRGQTPFTFAPPAPLPQDCGRGCSTEHATIGSAV
jgi:hypothetical protein